ncbi:unnamed protein product, partial [marine sediment metagenome]
MLIYIDWSAVVQPLNLRDLSQGDEPGLTPALGEAFAEAAINCLVLCKHETGIKLTVTGAYSSKLMIIWNMPTDQIAKAYADPQFATEFGAYGIAILLIKSLTNYSILE